MFLRLLLQILLQRKWMENHREGKINFSNVITKRFIVVILVICSCVGIYFGSWNFRTQSYHTLTESKNTELALRLLAYDYYSRDQQIYNPLSPDGLAEGVAERVREMSGAEGTLILGSWDAGRQAPRNFTYITGKFVVVYNFDEQEESRWKLCYQFREAAKPEWQ